MKALIADDHSLIRDGIKLILHRLMDPVDILEADNFSDAHALVKQHNDLDLITLDLFMPGMTGPKGVAVIRNSAPAVPVVVLSMSDDADHMRDVLKLGANGYIPKSSPNGILSHALSLVLDGGIYVPPEMLSNMAASPEISPVQDTGNTAPYLTERQSEVLSLVAEGRTNKEIARILAISVTTVKSHTNTIFRQLGAENRTQAVHHAIQLKLLEPMN